MCNTWSSRFYVWDGKFYVWAAVGSLERDWRDDLPVLVDHWWWYCWDNSWSCGSEDWGVFTEKFPVPECDSTRAMYADDVLVELSHLDDRSRLVPFLGMESCLILDADAVTYYQGRQFFRMLKQPFAVLHVAISKGELPAVERFGPRWVWLVFPRHDRYEVPDRPTEEEHGGG